MGLPHRVRSVVFSFAAMSVVGVVAVMACAPVAPSTPSAQATLSSIDGTEDGQLQLTPTVVLAEIDHSLRSKYTNYMQQKATKRRRGDSVEPVMVDIMVDFSTSERVYALVEFLESHADSKVYSDQTGYGVATDVTSAYVNIELLPAIAGIEGVQRISEVVVAQPVSN